MYNYKKNLKSILVAFVILSISIENVCGQASVLNLSPTTQGKQRECLTRNGTQGLCVLEKYCTAEHVIAQFGIIDDSELREKQCKENEWCCVLESVKESEEETEAPPKSNTSTDKVPDPSAACTPLTSSDCPWCVTIHKGALNDGRETGLYCMGSMLGPKTILTSSTCLQAARNITMWVQVPTSPNPKKKYGVRDTKQHSKYISGSHEYDFGLIILEEDVNWGKEKWKGVCLGLQASVEGDCVGFGFDGKNEIVATLLTSKHGGCSESGNTTDVACSKKYGSEDYCIIANGSPVVCQGNGEVTGVARSICYNDAALVGRLSLSRDWISEELKKLNVSPNNYLIKPNN